MPLSPQEARELRDGAHGLGLELEADQLAGFGVYLDLLARWNLRTNLLATKDRRALLGRHILDSLAAGPLVHAASAGATVLDIGSGGGLPGVPLAIACPEARVTLLEPRRKKVSFLREVARECSTWNISVEGCRTEDLVARNIAPFAIAVSRAAFAPSALPTAAASLVQRGGLLVSFTTGHSAPALEPTDGFGVPEMHDYTLPGHPAPFRLAVWHRR